MTLCKPKSYSWTARLAIGCAVVAGILPRACAHEGHKPLPARGVEVNYERGSILLTRDARDALGLQTADVALQTGEERILAYARLVAPWNNRALVSTQVPGRIVRLHVQPGDAVQAGQPLADIDSSEFQNLQLELINASNAFQLSEQLVKHYQALGTDVVAGSKLQEADSIHLKNVGTLETARIKLLNLGLADKTIEQMATGNPSQRLDSFPIFSPIRGTIYHSDLSIGKVVETSEHLFEVVDLSSVWSRIEILEKDLPKIQVGQSVEIHLPALPGKTFTGVIGVKEIGLDPVTYLGTAWVDLENAADQPPQLLPGMFGEAGVMIASPEPLLTVPPSAVARNGAERFVLVQEESTDTASQFIKRNVVVVRQMSGKIQFRADQVFPGDRVVTVGAHELFNFFVQSVLKLSPEAAQNIGLRTETVARQVVEEALAIDGRVELPAQQRDGVSIQLPGILTRLLVARGQYVRAGDVVCEVASLELQELQMQLLTADNERQNLETTVRRLEPLRESNAISQRQRWETENSLTQASQRADSLKRRLVSVGMSAKQIEKLLVDKRPIRNISLKATIDGYVVNFDKVIGQRVQLGETILEIHDPTSARIRGFVTEQEWSRIQLNQTARIRLVGNPGSIADAILVRSDQTLDPISRTLSVWFEIKDPGVDLQFQHNMLARANVKTGQFPPAIAVARESIVTEGRHHYVFVQDQEGRFQRRRIETGRSDDRLVEIKSGLQQGERIAAWGAVDLHSAYVSLR